jgi:hypothetical protein
MNTTIDTTDTARLIAQIAEAHARIAREPAAALNYALDAGANLIALKERLPHGALGDALAQIGINARTARLYMALARDRERIEAAGCKSIREAQRLLAPRGRSRRASSSARRTRDAEPDAGGDFQRGYDAGYRDGYAKRGRDEATARARANGNGGRSGLSVRDLRFAIKHLHPDRFQGEETDVKRATRLTVFLGDELRTARGGS